MHQLCRICLEILTSSSLNLSDVQEGFQISTIAMIILPIRIHSDDDVSLPHKICSSCLEILMKAFKLRETSLESDRFLRTNPTTTIMDIKPEAVQENQSIVISTPYNYDDNFQAQNFDISEIDIEFSDDLHVSLKRCQKQMSNASEAWNYFGKLMNGENRQVGCLDSNYCSLCLNNQKIVKYKKSTSSSTLSTHMLKTHGIDIFVKRRNVLRSKSVKNREQENSTKIAKSDLVVVEKISKNQKIKVKDNKKEVLEQPKKVSKKPFVRFEDGASTVCNECGKNFKSWAVLKKHLVIHGEKNFKCSRCPRRFFYKANLQKHEEIHEQNHLTRFTCDLCGGRYSELQTIRNHIQKFHLNIHPERKFVCNYDDCDFKFFSRDRLKRHMLTHSKLKPHECNYCDAAYASKGDLYKHLQKLHLGDALWNCEYCQESFRLKADLHKHYNVHYQHQNSNLEK